MNKVAQTKNVVNPTSSLLKWCCDYNARTWEQIIANVASELKSNTELEEGGLCQNLCEWL